MKRLAIAAFGAGCLVSLCASVAAGQMPVAPGVPSDRDPGFLTGSRFWLSAARLSGNGREFDWDADVGADLDLLDYGVGRLNFLANYEVVLGDEQQLFDPNQGNYVLDALGTVRLGTATEVGGLFHHVSRHLSDRAKNFPIDWNMFGIQVLDRRRGRVLDIESGVRALGVLKRSAVDYRSELSAHATARYALSPRVAILASGTFAALWVERDVFGRGAQHGGRLEAGVRLTGRGAAMDLFVAGERRIDASPFERRPRSWALVGFRVLDVP